MNNPIVLRFTAIVSLIISTTITIMFMTSGITEIFPCILTAAMGIILDLAKFGFTYEALINKALHMFIRIAMIIISLILIGSSILTASAFTLNQSNITRNKQIQNSTQYKQLEQSRTLQQDLYRIKKQEIEDLKALKISQKLDGDKIISTMPRSYTDKKNEQRRITSQQITETQMMIDKKSTELSQLELKLQNPTDTSNLKINSEIGYSSLFVKIAEMINTIKWFKNNPVSPETLELWFHILLRILFEFVAVVTAYLAQLKSKIIDNKIKKVKSPETLPPPNSYKDSEIDKDKVEQYVDYMYSKLKNGNVCKGYNTIGQYTGLGVENARKIKSHLQKLGIIHTIGTKTYTQVDLQTCKAKLQI